MGLFFVSYRFHPLPPFPPPVHQHWMRKGLGKSWELKEARSRVVMVCKSICWVDMQPPQVWPLRLS